MDNNNINLDTLNYADSTKVLKYSLQADQPVTIEGPPGVGKTAMVNQVAAQLDREVAVLILSQCEPTDVGGFPFISGTGDKAVRLPLGPIKDACDRPVILFLDELTTAPPAVQGAALRLIYERVAGDIKLHPGTRIVAAQNPPDQAAGGWEMALPLIGRLTKIRMYPLLEEVQDFFYRLGAEGSKLRELAVDFAATLKSEPKLLQIDPPAGAATTGAPWGAPRSWERSLRVLAHAVEGGESDTSKITAAILAGNVGPESAAAFMNIRKIRHKLPTIDQIMDKPDTAMVPSDGSTAIAALGLVAQVCTKDPCPALVYANRLPDDARSASLTMIATKFRYKDFPNSKWYAEADKAIRSMVRSLGHAMRDK